MRAKALVIPEAGRIELRDAEVREPGPGEVLIESVRTGVSPGTELRCFRGQQAGTAYPFIPGYALVGRVVARGAGVTLAEGRLVLSSGTTHAAGLHLLWGGHCSHAVVPAASVHAVPDGVPADAAALAPLAAIAWHGMRRSRPQPLERVAVVGLGAIGLCSALAHRVAGAEVVACDRSPQRRGRAAELGVRVVDPGNDAVAAFAAVFPGGADIVVDATGVPAALASSIALARTPAWGDEHAVGPRLLLQGSYADAVPLPYEAAFGRELTLLVPRATLPSDHAAVLALLGNGALDLRPLAGPARPPADAARTYADLAGGDPSLVTAVFAWRD